MTFSIFRESMILKDQLSVESSNLHRNKRKKVAVSKFLKISISVSSKKPWRSQETPKKVC
jgi:hypothetical protein